MLGVVICLGMVVVLAVLLLALATVGARQNEESVASFRHLVD